MKKLVSIATLAVLSILLPACDFTAKKPAKAGIIIDTLSPESYKEVHIGGAINIPFVTEAGKINPAYDSREAFEREVKKQLGVSPAARPIFIYCTNDVCTTSDVAAEMLRGFGFNAQPYKSGLAGWVALHLYKDAAKYPVAPSVEQGKKFTVASYLNTLTEHKPEELTAERMAELERAAQPLVEALQPAA